MGKGAIHYTGTNFPRVPRLDIVQRMRLLVQQEVVRRPPWLQAAERSPPLELFNIKLLDRRVPNKYMKLTQEVLRKYPNMRFMDCYVDGNDWSKGNDVYRADHPVMQFVALQLRLMNLGLSEKAAFQQAEKAFFARRIALEKQQKLSMAAAVAGAVARDPAAAATAAAATATAAAAVPSSSQARVAAMGLGEVQPLFTTGQAYWQFCIAQSQANHLLRIRQVLRRMRSRAEAVAAKEAASATQEEAAGDNSSRLSSVTAERQRNVFPSLRQRTFSASGRRRRAALLQQQQQSLPHSHASTSSQLPFATIHPQVAAATAALAAYPPTEASVAPAGQKELWEADQEDFDPTLWVDETQLEDFSEILPDD